MRYPENHALIGREPRHYQRIGLRINKIHPWEDGWRTSTAPGTRGTFE